MSSVRLKPMGKDARGKMTYRAHFDAMGAGLLPVSPQMPGSDMMKPKAGVRGWKPRGVDRRRA